MSFLNARIRRAAALLAVLVVVFPAAARACWAKHGTDQPAISKVLLFKSAPESLPAHEKPTCRLEDCMAASVPSQTLSGLWGQPQPGQFTEALAAHLALNGLADWRDLLIGPAFMGSLPCFRFSSPEVSYDSLLC